jgi:DNA-directed RNA polymerase specialized sigma24 family protein
MESSDGRLPDSLVATAYGAAIAVSANAAVAQHVTAVALEAEPGREQDLVTRTLRLAARTAPAPQYRRMSVQQREAVALARPGGATADEIAATLEVSTAEAKRRMLEGLRAVAAAPVRRDDVRRTPQPPPGFAGAASPGRGARAS